MDKRYSEFLESVEKPCFILVKNLDFEHPSDLDSPISRGEIVGHSNNFEDLRNLIPSPGLPEDEYKLSLFEKKFGEIKSSVAQYDDSPWDISEGDPNDYEIFNESYTIIWICEQDEDSITDYLVRKYSEIKDLISIWELYLDRMHIFPYYSLDQTSEDFYEKICNFFEEKVNGHDDPPSEKEWDELNDYL
ncbi:MAG: hypothetical protein KFF73_20100 [Cyclobacteriaceae bacterium]|nr:hypothetical protein [Cyclobacteriaceae bacterium]